MKLLALCLILATPTIQAQDYSRNLPPIVLTRCTPRYTDEARRAKLEGTVILSVEIDAEGHAHPIQVKQSLGMGLDETAADAVAQWRFKPGEKHGELVVTPATIHIIFKLIDLSKVCSVVSPDGAAKRR